MEKIGIGILVILVLLLSFSCMLPINNQDEEIYNSYLETKNFMYIERLKKRIPHSFPFLLKIIESESNHQILYKLIKYLFSFYPNLAEEITPIILRRLKSEKNRTIFHNLINFSNAKTLYPNVKFPNPGKIFNILLTRLKTDKESIIIDEILAYIYNYVNQYNWDEFINVLLGLLKKDFVYEDIFFDHHYSRPPLIENIVWSLGTMSELHNKTVINELKKSICRVKFRRLHNIYKIYIIDAIAELEEKAPLEVFIELLFSNNKEIVKSLRFLLFDKGLDQNFFSLTIVVPTRIGYEASSYTMLPERKLLLMLLEKLILIKDRKNKLIANYLLNKFTGKNIILKNDFSNHDLDRVIENWEIFYLKNLPYFYWKTSKDGHEIITIDYEAKKEGLPTDVYRKKHPWKSE